MIVATCVLSPISAKKTAMTLLSGWNKRRAQELFGVQLAHFNWVTFRSFRARVDESGDCVAVEKMFFDIADRENDAQFTL
jgi:hypothetical protein